MTKQTVLKIAGVVGIVAGAVCLFLSGTGEAVGVAIIGGVFVLAGIIASLFKVT